MALTSMKLHSLPPCRLCCHCIGKCHSWIWHTVFVRAYIHFCYNFKISFLQPNIVFFSSISWLHQRLHQPCRVWWWEWQWDQSALPWPSLRWHPQWLRGPWLWVSRQSQLRNHWWLHQWRYCSERGLQRRCLLHHWWPLQKKNPWHSSEHSEAHVQWVRQNLRHVFQPEPAQTDTPLAGQQASKEMSDLWEGVRVHASHGHAPAHTRPQAQVWRVWESV